MVSYLSFLWNEIFAFFKDDANLYKNYLYCFKHLLYSRYYYIIPSFYHKKYSLVIYGINVSNLVRYTQLIYVVQLFSIYTSRGTQFFRQISFKQASKYIMFKNKFF